MPLTDLFSNLDPVATMAKAVIVLVPLTGAEIISRPLLSFLVLNIVLYIVIAKRPYSADEAISGKTVQNLILLLYPLFPD